MVQWHKSDSWEFAGSNPAKRKAGDEFLCGAHQNARKMLVYTCFDTHEAVVHGFGVLCVVVKCGTSAVVS